MTFNLIGQYLLDACIDCHFFLLLLSVSGFRKRKKEHSEADESERFESQHERSRETGRSTEATTFRKTEIGNLIMHL